MAKKAKVYTVKVPVYTSEMIENPQDMFGGITYDEMVSYINIKINNFNNANIPLVFENRNKTRRTVIDNITTTSHNLDSIPGVLLRISAYGTNFYDGYIETERKIKFKKNYKIGSDTNFVFIYPVIKGLKSSKYTRYFIILIYEDPTKSNDEIAKVAKNVLNKILEIPVANIKIPTLLEELRELRIIPKLQVKYSAIYNEENEVDVKYQEYQVGGKFKKQKEDYFQNMPFDKIEDLLKEEDKDGYQKKETKLSVGKKDYIITKELINEARENLKEVGEKVFNASTTITPEELDEKFDDPDFIISKLTPILGNYLSSDDDHK